MNPERNCFFPQDRHRENEVGKVADRLKRKKWTNIQKEI